MLVCAAAAMRRYRRRRRLSFIAIMRYPIARLARQRITD